MRTQLCVSFALVLTAVALGGCAADRAPNATSPTVGAAVLAPMHSAVTAGSVSDEASGSTVLDLVRH
jgi:hypothetical protein